MAHRRELEAAGLRGVEAYGRDGERVAASGVRSRRAEIDSDAARPPLAGTYRQLVGASVNNLLNVAHARGHVKSVYETMEESDGSESYVCQR